MKKNTFKISVILAILVSFCFTCIFISCGPNSSTEVSATGSRYSNWGYGWGNYSYNHICIIAGDDHHCYEVERWWDNEGAGIEVKVKNGGYIFASEGTYHIYSQSSDCHFCK